MLLTTDQLNHYDREGYVVLRGFIAPDEITMMREDVVGMIDSAPVAPRVPEDSAGVPVVDPADFAFTKRSNGGYTLNRISNPLARSETLLVSYGNPRLLGAVNSLHGPHFVPFAESVVIKLPDHGAPFDWHQDGSFKTGWQDERGINFGIYLHESNERNGCVYAIPGSHKKGRADLSAMVAEHGERLPGSVPVAAEPGDVIVHSRNLIHGSFANASSTLRVTVYFGFHHVDTVRHIYSDEQIATRAHVISEAIVLRHADVRFGDEVPFEYLPPPGYRAPKTELSTALRAPALMV